MDIKFEDVPNGLAAFFKLPVQGGAQIVTVASFIDHGLLFGRGQDHRPAEVRHSGGRAGQLAMFALMGYIVPGYYNLHALLCVLRWECCASQGGGRAFTGTAQPPWFVERLVGQ